MNYIKIQIEAKQFTISLMQDNVKLFGGESAVKHKVSLLSFEIAQLTKSLDSWH